MGIMGLGLDPGKPVAIEVIGEDEEEALAAISEFLET
jgi:phosphotransferase system HPr-like phosphotransfer protein